jgi:ABC-type antimicrobial peptide transport system permease subunit
MFMLPLVQAGRNDKNMQVSMNAGAIVLQVNAITPGLEQQVRRTLATIDPNLTVDQYQTFAAQIAGQFNQERMLARLTTLFGSLALLLAAIGLYGVTAYTVARRSSEIGIRMALGAERSGVVAMVLRGALLQTGIGLAIGIPVALLMCMRYVNDQLYNVTWKDTGVMSGAVLALAVAACIAGLIPAQRAASLDPVKALRTE